MIREYSSLDNVAVNLLGKELKSNFDIESRGELEKVLVYQEQGKIVGFLVYTQLYEVIELLYIVVDRNYRRSGVGRKLVEYLYKTPSERIILEVRSSNVSAIEFYVSLGFKPIRTIRNYYDGVEDAISMEREIL